MNNGFPSTKNIIEAEKQKRVKQGKKLYIYEERKKENFLILTFYYFSSFY